MKTKKEIKQRMDELYEEIAQYVELLYSSKKFTTEELTAAGKLNIMLSQNLVILNALRWVLESESV